MAILSCTMPGCERKHRARGLCGVHYNKMKNYPDNRERRTPATCETCGTEYDRSFGVHTNSCPQCAHKIQAQRATETTAPRRAAARAAKAAQPKHMQNLTCAQCLSEFQATRARKYCDPVCSNEAEAIRQGSRNRICRECNADLGYYSLLSLCGVCRAAAKTASNRANRQRRRARIRNVEHETIKAAIVYERDGWRCGICRKRVRKTLAYPHPMSASLDHIVPLAHGGSHTYANTQLAHWSCNHAKGAALGTGVQALLFG